MDEGGVSEQIAEMRLQYWEGRRRTHTEQVEGTIRAGFLDQVTELGLDMKHPSSVRGGSVGNLKGMHGR